MLWQKGSLAWFLCFLRFYQSTTNTNNNYNLRKRTKLYPLSGHGTGFSAMLLLKGYAIVTVRSCGSTILNSQKLLLFSDPLQGVSTPPNILRIIVFILRGYIQLRRTFFHHPSTVIAPRIGFIIANNNII